jgi:hypothetical protein
MSKPPPEKKREDIDLKELDEEYDRIIDATGLLRHYFLNLTRTS